VLDLLTRPAADPYSICAENSVPPPSSLTSVAERHVTGLAAAAVGVLRLCHQPARHHRHKCAAALLAECTAWRAAGLVGGEGLHARLCKEGRRGQRTAAAVAAAAQSGRSCEWQAPHLGNLVPLLHLEVNNMPLLAHGGASTVYSSKQESQARGTM
jgi:hypothetical protein